MIAAPMPLLWRRADATSPDALAKVIITASRVGDLITTRLRCRWRIFPIRYIWVDWAWAWLRDGIVSFDGLMEAQERTPPVFELEGNPAARRNRIFDVTPAVQCGGAQPSN
jgi:hypothetical protein